MSSKLTFPCTRCTACCRSMGAILARRGEDGQLREEVEAFPYGVDADGVCEKLVGDGCSVYADRPALCDIAGVRHRFPDLSDREYIEVNMKACAQLIEHFGMDR